ncbi:hypothetical protein [Rhodoferax sp.]|uniref:hypothetical protein n=1 Tax=Rhodoferax sp. TaxID=50421 RepID=UPI003BB6B9AA
MSAEIAAVRCPVSALFGNQDEYGWRPSAMALFEHGTMSLEVIALSGVGHHPQQRARGETLQQLQRLIGRMGYTTQPTTTGKSGEGQQGTRARRPRGGQLKRLRRLRSR